MQTRPSRHQEPAEAKPVAEKLPRGRRSIGPGFRPLQRSSEAAQTVGIDEFVVSARIDQYERGKHVPDLLTAQHLAAELEVPVSYLFEPNDYLAELLRLVGRLSTSRLRALLKALNDEKQ